MPPRRAAKRAPVRNPSTSDDDDEVFEIEKKTRRKSTRTSSRKNGKCTSSASSINNGSKILKTTNRKDNAASICIMHSPQSKKDIVDLTSTYSDAVHSSDKDESDIEILEKNQSNEIDEDINNENEDKVLPLAGFDPTQTFSDSDSDDLYSISHSAIKASAHETASKNYIQSQIIEQETLLKEKKEACKSITSEGNTSVINIISEGDDGSDSICSSPDVDSIKLSARKLVKVSKKTQKLFDKFVIMEKKLDDDIINDCSMNKMLDYDPDFEILTDGGDETLDVRLKHGLNYIKMPIKKKEGFGYIYQQVAEKYDVSFDRVVLSFRDEIISPEQTPLDLKLTFVDIVEIGIIKNSKVNATEDSSDTNSITLKMQCSERRATVSLSINKFEKMITIMQKYAKKKGTELSKLKFMFDGEKLDPNETPLSLDLEGGECIDIYPVK